MRATLPRRTVVQQLREEPYRFEFFQAVRLLVEWLGLQGIAPEPALTEHLFFENSLALSFPPAQVAALAIVADASPQIRLTPAFMGFLGASGTLPHHYTERIGHYESGTKDGAPRAFLDMFSNRALAQFYRAWRKHRIEQPDSTGKDGFLPLLLSLAGFQPGAGAGPEARIGDEIIAQYAGATIQRPLPPGVLGRMLADYLGVPVAIDESTGAWITLREAEQCALGGRNADLGSNTLLGDRSWRPDLHAQICIGPLNRTAFDQLLPGGERARALAQLLRLFGNLTVSYAVRLTLKAQDIWPLCLAGGATPPARLGQDSFLVDTPGGCDRSDMVYHIRLLEPLPPLPARPASGASL